MAESPFLSVPPDQWIASNAKAFAIWDRFPVSPGHALIVTKRPVVTWFDADEEEQASLIELVDTVARHMDATLRPQPDGYNVGFNAGAAAGQTVMHLHLHVIPRYDGDVDDPRGGVRCVIPAKGNYLVSSGSIKAAPDSAQSGGDLQLCTGPPDAPLWEQLSWRVATATSIDILAAFVQSSGLDVIESRLFEAVDQGASVRILVSDYLYISSPKALRRLHGWETALAAEAGRGGAARGTLSSRLVQYEALPDQPASFHPKSWYIADGQGGLLSVGSSNLSQAALETGVEWNLLSTASDSVAHQRFQTEFGRLWEAASPLTSELITQYADRVEAYRRTHFLPEADDYRSTPTARPWQTEALAALRTIRESGYRRALVAVATGMGKTWLAAFDAQQVGDQLGQRPRVLVIAHRAHILAQAEAAFSQLLGSESHAEATSWYLGPHNDLAGDLVLASIQKLSREEGLARLGEEWFDYVVIDEVHHAEAPTYRRVLARLQAGFILGLTATPERTDGIDVARIFDDILAYQATIGDGIAEESLVPFHYIGIKDTVDFQQVPWRNGRFETEELERRVVRSERMDRLWTTMEQHPAERTLFFCCSRRQAIFTRDWLREQGVSAAAVFSGSGGDHCGQSLEQLHGGRLNALCVVDMFNEGLDIPAVDRIVMLRPTESKIIFLQQLGRGLRAIEGKSRLLVIDFVGNHRIFAQRMIHLLSLGGRDAGWKVLEDWLQGDLPQLPEGCLLDVELAARDMLKKFLPPGAEAGIEAYRALRDELGRRPTAAELFNRGYLPKVVSRGAGNWFEFVEREGDLTEVEGEVVAQYQQWLATVQTTSLNKSYKMVVLRVLLEQGKLFQGVDLAELARACRTLLQNHPVLKHDLEGGRHAIDHQHADDETWAAWWIKWPIDRWLDQQNGIRWFQRDGDRFVFQVECPPRWQAVLESLTEELVDWRLAAYAHSRRLGETDDGQHVFEAKVSHAGGRPILFVPEKAKAPGRPVGLTWVRMPDGLLWELKFVKVAVNVARPEGASGNQLGQLLQQWFGPDAGLPGTNFRVKFWRQDGQWQAAPRGAAPEKVAVEQVPAARQDLPVVATVSEAARYTTHVPVYDLTVAAGDWGPDGVPAEIGWTEVRGHALSPGMFVAQVTGHSMAPVIEDGQWCLFRPCPAGSRQNRLLLVQVNTHVDPADGGRYVVKRYRSTKRTDPADWEHTTIKLEPLNEDYNPIEITADAAKDLRVIGEWICVIEESEGETTPNA